MLKYLLGIALLIAGLNTRAQSVEEDVMQVVVSLFNGMREADSVAVKNAFLPGAIMQTISEKTDGTVEVLTQSVGRFVGSVGGQSTGALDERVMFDMVKVEGNLASVWTPYLFNHNGSLSHCGVNSFQLVKVDEQWKINYIIDTRKKEGCGPSHLFK